MQADVSQTTTPYETTCKLIAIGSPDGTGLATMSPAANLINSLWGWNRACCQLRLAFLLL